MLYSPQTRNGAGSSGHGMSGGRERELINYLEKLQGEGRAATEHTDLDRADDLLAFARGEQWPENTPRGIIDFVLNLSNDIVQRKVSLLTDSRPAMQVVTANPDWETQARGLEKILQAVWQESSWQGEELPKGIAMAAVAGCNFALMRWDPLADQGRGDLRPHFLDPRSIVLDPTVTRASRLHEGEYICTRAVRSIASLIEQYGERALRVKSDTGVSQFPEPDRSRRGRGFWSPLMDAGRRALGGRDQRRRMQDSGIERAIEHHVWFRDFQRYGDDEPMAGQPNYRARRLIRHVVWAGDVVLLDEPNPNWFESFPHEILDWGMELEHPFGQSEVGQLRKAQEALNSLASDILRNTKFNNNFKLVMDSNALNPEDEARLSNKPMLILRKRPGSDVRFESPPPLPAYLFQLLSWLVSAMELVSGMTDVMRGGTGGSTSGLQLEGMQLAAQTVIRLQARRVEDFLQRLWSKGIPLVFQHYTSNRVKTILGPGDEWEVFTFQRYAFVSGMNDPRESFRDFGLKIVPGSSLATTRLQKVSIAMNLYNAGLIPGLEVLKQAEWGPDPEQSIDEARQELAARASGLGAPTTGLQAAIGGRQGRRANQAFPAGAIPVT